MACCRVATAAGLGLHAADDPYLVVGDVADAVISVAVVVVNDLCSAMSQFYRGHMGLQGNPLV